MQQQNNFEMFENLLNNIVIEENYEIDENNKTFLSS